MNQKYEKYLPIGSVVLLKNAKKRLMITGFYIVPNEDNSKIYDYSGCLYPEGLINSEQTAVFNHDQIDKIYAIGYSDDEEKQFKNKLNELINNSTKVEIPILSNGTEILETDSNNEK